MVRRKKSAMWIIIASVSTRADYDEQDVLWISSNSGPNCSSATFSATADALACPAACMVRIGVVLVYFNNVVSSAQCETVILTGVFIVVKKSFCEWVFHFFTFVSLDR